MLQTLPGWLHQTCSRIDSIKATFWFNWLIYNFRPFITNIPLVLHRFWSTFIFIQSMTAKVYLQCTLYIIHTCMSVSHHLYESHAPKRAHFCDVHCCPNLSRKQTLKCLLSIALRSAVLTVSDVMTKRKVMLIGNVPTEPEQKDLWKLLKTRINFS